MYVNYVNTPIIYTLLFLYNLNIKDMHIVIYEYYKYINESVGNEVTN